MSDLPELSGPFLPPHDGGPAKRLVVLLHGYGADGHDLIGLGKQWGPDLPGTAFVSPHAPSPCMMAPMGRQWFPLPEISIEVARDGVCSALPVLESFLDTALTEHQLNVGDVALVGFSQGGMMALAAGLKHSYAGIISYSGILGVDTPPSHPRQGYPPVLLVHGDADPVVPSSALGYSRGLLDSWGVEVSAHLRPGLGHGIDGQGLGLGLDFLRNIENPGP